MSAREKWNRFIVDLRKLGESLDGLGKKKRRVIVDAAREWADMRLLEIDEEMSKKGIPAEEHWRLLLEVSELFELIGFTSKRSI